MNRAAPDVTLYVLMCASVFLVATSRAHLITMLLFLFVTAWKTGKRYFWFGAMLTTVAIAWWMWMAIPSAVDFRLQRAHSTGQIVQLYLSNPGELLSVLYRNFSDANALQGYWRSFIGGFMGVWVPVFVPVVLTIVFLILLVVNATGAVVRDNILVRSTLLVTGVGSAFLAVLAMLLTWNDYPVPSIIEGVQGRYFLVPAILAFMAISCWSKPSEKCRKTSAALLAVFFVFGYTVTTRLLVDAFYVPWSAQPRPVTGEDRVNGPFGSGRPVVIRFERLAETIANDVNQIGILTATYGRKLEGTGRAVFHASNGKTVFLDFPLSDFKDGRYIYFDLPSASWTNAELHVLSGEGGGSVWEYRPFSSGDSPAAWQACVVLKNANGTRQVTEGCRKP